MLAMTLWRCQYTKFLRGTGKKIPQEIQLVGFDDVGFGKLFIPELTTIHQPIREMGHLAAEIIIKAVNKEPYEKENVLELNW